MRSVQNMINIILNNDKTFNVVFSDGNFKSDDIESALKYVSSSQLMRDICTQITKHASPEILQKITNTITKKNIETAMSFAINKENSILQNGLTPFFNPVIRIRTSNDSSQSL